MGQLPGSSSSGPVASLTSGEPPAIVDTEIGHLHNLNRGPGTCLTPGPFAISGLVGRLYSDVLAKTPELGAASPNEVLRRLEDLPLGPAGFLEIVESLLIQP